jgi:hypothetical protein
VFVNLQGENISPADAAAMAEQAFMTCLALIESQPGREVNTFKTGSKYAPKEFAPLPEAKGHTKHQLAAAMELACILLISVAVLAISLFVLVEPFPLSASHFRNRGNAAPHRSASPARSIAGLSGFLTLSQSADRPERYGAVSDAATSILWATRRWLLRTGDHSSMGQTWAPTATAVAFATAVSRCAWRIRFTVRTRSSRQEIRPRTHLSAGPSQSLR